MAHQTGLATKDTSLPSSQNQAQAPLTLQDLGFPPSDEDQDMDYDTAMEGINVDDLDPDTEDEDLLDDMEDQIPPSNAL
jgi:hypothetical protein